MRHTQTYERLLGRLRNLRKDHSLTQEEVARAINISRSQYTMVEGGDSVASLDHLCGLAMLYRISLSTLFEGIDEMRTKGSRVMKCPTCTRRVVGMPGTKVNCPGCGKPVTLANKARQ